MRKTQLRHPGAKLPAAPISPGLSVGDLVFLSGSTGINPATEELAGPDVKSQTRQVLRNLQALLIEAGLGMQHVLKTTVFLTRGEDFKGMNEIYREFFTDPWPTRSTVIIAGLARAGCVVEIEAIAGR